MTTTAARSFIGRSPTFLAALVALVALQCVSAKKECAEIKPGKLKKLAADSHILLKIDKKFPSGDAEDQYKDLCARYKDTPLERSRDLVIGHFAIDTYGDDDAKKRAMDVAKKFGADNESEWPTYVLLKKGTKEASDAVKFDGEKTVDGLTTYMRDEIDVKIGTLLYYIDTLDRMSSRFMGVDENGDTKAQLERKGYGYIAKIMIFLYRGEAKDIANQYGKVFTNMLKDGNSYATKNKDRLEGMLKSDSNMSSAKKEEVAQRIHILEKFTEPVEVSDEDNRSFLFSVAWNVVLLVLMFVLSISMFFFEDKDSGKEGADEKKAEDTSDGKEENVDGEDDTEVETETKKGQ